MTTEEAKKTEEKKDTKVETAKEEAPQKNKTKAAPAKPAAKKTTKKASAKKATPTTTKEVSRIYVVPLLKEWGKVPRYKRAKKAMKAIREFMVRHMKVRDRDLRKIRLDPYLNEEVWFRGIKKPPHKIKVKATQRDDGTVYVELVDFKPKLHYKKLRAEKMLKAAEEKKVARAAKKAAAQAQAPEVKVEKEEGEDSKEEKKEKDKAVQEAGQVRAEQQHKKQKHQTDLKAKEPKHQQRKALQK